MFKFFKAFNRRRAVNIAPSPSPMSIDQFSNKISNLISEGVTNLINQSNLTHGEQNEMLSFALRRHLSSFALYLVFRVLRDEFPDDDYDRIRGPIIRKVAEFYIHAENDDLIKDKQDQYLLKLLNEFENASSLVQWLKMYSGLEERYNALSSISDCLDHFERGLRSIEEFHGRKQSVNKKHIFKLISEIFYEISSYRSIICSKDNKEF